MRFVIVGFLFLALVFFEMSGGTDFDPRETLASRIDGPLPSEATIEEDMTEEIEVSRISLDLTSMNEVLLTRTNARLRTIAARQRRNEPQPIPAVNRAVAPETILKPRLTGQAIITPVVFGRSAADQDAPNTNSAASETTADVDNSQIARVTGTSVNVRSGPGTDYEVVDQLRKGDRVIVLEDTGTGWVRLRPADGGREGWMADFLLTLG